MLVACNLAVICWEVSLMLWPHEIEKKCSRLSLGFIAILDIWGRGKPRSMLLMLKNMTGLLSLSSE